MKVIIDRFEGDYAVLEMMDGSHVDIPKILVPDTKEGDVISIKVEKEETETQKKQIESLMNDLFE